MNELIRFLENIYPLQWALIGSVVFILFVAIKTKNLMAMGISCIICTLGLTGFYFTERKAEDQQVKMYGNAIQMFYNDFGYLPAEQDDISSVLYPLTFPIEGYGPYIETERYKERDVWNNLMCIIRSMTINLLFTVKVFYIKDILTIKQVIWEDQQSATSEHATKSKKQAINLTCFFCIKEVLLPTSKSFLQSPFATSNRHPCRCR